MKFSFISNLQWITLSVLSVFGGFVWICKDNTFYFKILWLTLPNSRIKLGKSQELHYVRVFWIAASVSNFWQIKFVGTCNFSVLNTNTTLKYHICLEVILYISFHWLHNRPDGPNHSTFKNVLIFRVMRMMTHTVAYAISQSHWAPAAAHGC